MPNNTIHFTKASINALEKPQDGQPVEYCDDETRGLRVRVTVTGAKSFYLLRKLKGRTERVLLGRFPETKVSQAKKKAGEVHSSMDAGINPNESKRVRRGELIVGELFDIYYKRHALPHTKRPEDIKWHFDTYIKKSFGSKKISDVSQKMVDTWHKSLGSNNGKVTANRALALFKTMFNSAISWDLWSGRNPADAVKRFKEKARCRIVSLAELDKLYVALREEPNKDIRDFFMMLLITGARRGNVQSMSWDDISLDGESWNIPETKNGESLNLPLVSSALSILKGRFVNDEKPKGYVFTGAGKTGHIVEPKKAWARVLDRVEIKDLRIHDLRHVFGSYLAATGANQFIIRDAMGHKDIKSSSRYVQMGQEIIKEFMEKSTNVITEKAGNLIPKAEVIQLDVLVNKKESENV